MKKKILAVVMSVIMLLGLIPLTALADAAEPKFTFTFEADKEVAAPGDVITFTGYTEAAIETCGWQYKLDIPEGLTYVPNSGAIVDGLKELFSVDGDCSFTEVSKIVLIGSANNLTNVKQNNAIVTFQCTVDADAADGVYTVSAKEFDVLDEDVNSLGEDEYEVIGAEVTVKSPPKFIFTFEADKAEAVAGEVVTFTGYTEAAIETCGWQYKLDIPEGLTYVPNSGAIVDGLKELFSVDGDCSFTEVSKIVLIGSANNLTNVKQKNAIVTFQCTVDDDAQAGSVYTVSAKEFDVLDEDVNSLGEDEFEVIGATVTVVDHICTADKLTAVDAVDATCTEDGNIAYYECECGKFYADAEASEEIDDVITPATGHDYEPVVTDPTCTEGGYTTYTCSVCDDSYEDDEVAETGHTDGEWKVTTPATCDEAGVETLYCAVCEEEIGTRDIPATGHDYEPVVTDPTCTEGGYTTYTCSVCGDSYEDDEVAETGHTDGEWKVTTPATCTTAGVETLYCAVCEAEIGTKEIPATGHTDGEWKVTTPATCTTAGEETLYCAVCEAAIGTRDIPATGHDYEPVVTAPTCTEAGYTTYTCSVCGDSYEADVVDATGHDDSGEYVEDPANPGTWYLYCANDCGEILDEDIRTIFVDGIKLDQDNVVTKYIRKSPAFTLTAFINPEEATENYTVTWSSSNEKVATVDEDGNVTTHKRGCAVITATVTKADGTQYTASCNVQVKYTLWQWLIWFFLLGCLWYFV